MTKLKVFWSEKDKRLKAFVDDVLRSAGQCFKKGDDQTGFQKWISFAKKKNQVYRASYQSSRSEIYEKLVGSLFSPSRGIPKLKGEKKGKKKENREIRRRVLREATDGFSPERVISEIDVKSLGQSTVFERLFGSPEECRSKIKRREDLVRGIHEAGQFILNPPMGDFWGYVDLHNSTPGARWFLAVRIADRITRLGPTLACNFMIDIFVREFCKPDASIKNLLCEVGLMPTKKVDDFSAFWIVQQIAQRTEVQPLVLDKALWMLKSDVAVNDGWVADERRKEFLKRWQNPMA